MDLNLFYFDKDISKRRIEEIDNIRKNGGQTDLEIWWKKSLKKEKYEPVNPKGKKIYVSIIEINSKKEQHYEGLRRLCRDYDLKYSKIKWRLHNSEYSEIRIDNKYIIQRIDEVDNELFVEDESDGYKPNKGWPFEVADKLVKMRQLGKTFTEIGEALGKSSENCNSKYNRLVKNGDIKYFLDKGDK